MNILLIRGGNTCRSLMADALLEDKLWETGRSDEFIIMSSALHTGMRRGKILALSWRDIDLNLMTTSINRSLQVLQDKTKIIREPKTKNLEGRST